MLPLNLSIATPHPLYAAVTNLLHAPLFVHLVRSALFICVQKKGGTESLLHTALHAVAAALTIPPLDSTTVCD